MNVSTVRLIVPLLCGLLCLAVLNSNAKEPQNAKPSPTPKSSEKATTVKSSKSNSSDRATTINNSKSNNFRTANPKASATPNRDVQNNLVGIDYRPAGDAKQKYKAKVSPTPKAK